jgi:hypothetical protein
VCIRPDVKATYAFQSSRRFQFSSRDIDWEDNLHPSGRQGNTVRTRSLIRKLRAYNLHPFGLQGNTVWMQSLIRKLLVDKEGVCYFRAIPSGRTMERQLQFSVRTHSASFQTLIREVRFRFDLGFLKPVKKGL